MSWKALLSALGYPVTIRAMATKAGTGRFVSRFPDLPGNHWREALGVRLSSIGMGTYLGDPDEATDRACIEAVSRVLSLGVNVIDTAINYRFQRAERAIGAAFVSGKIDRDEIFLCTKGGFFSFDGGPPKDATKWLSDTFTGIINPSDVVGGCHCLNPKYLRHQVDQSLRNLRVDSVDVYYLHNPEMQLDHVDREEFDDRIRAAFETLEEGVERGKIGRYGAATWDALRVPPGTHNHVSLEKLVEIARGVAGENHHFGVVQLPLNMMMTEAIGEKTQEVKGRQRTALEAAADLGLAVFTSVPLMQGRILGDVPESLREKFAPLETDSQRAIQFARSAPGVVAPLVGMKAENHIFENLKTTETAPLAEDDFYALFPEA